MELKRFGNKNRNTQNNENIYIYNSVNFYWNFSSLTILEMDKVQEISDYFLHNKTSNQTFKI